MSPGTLCSMCPNMLVFLVFLYYFTSPKVWNRLLYGLLSLYLCKSSSITQLQPRHYIYEMHKWRVVIQTALVKMYSSPLKLRHFEVICEMKVQTCTIHILSSIGSSMFSWLVLQYLWCQVRSETVLDIKSFILSWLNLIDLFNDVLLYII